MCTDHVSVCRFPRGHLGCVHCGDRFSRCSLSCRGPLDPRGRFRPPTSHYALADGQPVLEPPRREYHQAFLSPAVSLLSSMSPDRRSRAEGPVPERVRPPTAFPRVSRAAVVRRPWRLRRWNQTGPAPCFSLLCDSHSIRALPFALQRHRGGKQIKERRFSHTLNCCIFKQTQTVPSLALDRLRGHQLGLGGGSLKALITTMSFVF